MGAGVGLGLPCAYADEIIGLQRPGHSPSDTVFLDTATGKERASLQHTGEVLCLAVSADGKHLAAGSWDRNIALWDLSKVLATKKP